jgi:hypothetical protein
MPTKREPAAMTDHAAAPTPSEEATGTPTTRAALRALPPEEGGDVSIDVAPDRCWCGVENPYFAPLPPTCGGYFVYECDCGGDQCVCHWHGEVECDGCPDCEGDDEP